MVKLRKIFLSVVILTAPPAFIATIGDAFGFSPTTKTVLSVLVVLISLGPVISWWKRPVGNSASGAYGYRSSKSTARDLKDFAVGLLVLAFIWFLFKASYALSSKSVGPDNAPVAIGSTAAATEPVTHPPVRTGTWEEFVPPGEYSKWTVWYRNYKTDGELSEPARYLKGKVVDNKVVVYDMPLQWDRPGTLLLMSYDEAIRYYNEGTNTLKITWTRRRY